jgi:hypothetical protein
LIGTLLHGSCTASKPFGRTQMVSSALVMSRGKRFESARRLSLIALGKPNTQND